jgi:hypothetical protein
VRFLFPELELGQSSLVLTGGTPFEVAINSNTSWAASTTASWLTITPTSGSGSSSLQITATRNTGVTMRTAEVVIQGDELSRTLTVFQQPDGPATTWAGWSIQDGAVDTGRFLGVLDVRFDPFVWSLGSDCWLYLPQPFVRQDGSWIYLYR